MVITDQNIQYLLKTARKAGDAILDIYESDDFGVEMKGDDSPLTKADKASHEVIQKALSEQYPDIPILSEEGRDMPYEERKHWKTFWCVDPLDGTKEFIKRNGEFTVNIALIDHGKPVAGVIYIPVKDVMYYATIEKGAYKIDGDAEPKKISVNEDTSDGIIAVRSRSHASEEEDVVLKKYGVTESISAGSSLKFCMVAEGKAHIYYRHGPTMEWDTAAGHAIVIGAGGITSSDYALRYNKEELRNGSFLILTNGISDDR